MTSTMPSKNPPKTAPNYSANDNGPLTAGQVKALKWAIAIMGLMIVVSLIAIVARVIYLASVKKPATKSATAITELAPAHTIALPVGATVKSLSLQGNRLLVHYETAAGHGAAILDLATGKSLSRVRITTEKSDHR